MKNTIKISALALALTSLSTNAMAISGNASANVLGVLTLAETNTLNFGDFTAGTGGTISQSGDVTGDVSYIGSSAQAALFTVGDSSAANSIAYNVTIPASVQLDKGGDNMTASLSVPGGTAQALVSGSDTFNVHGVLTVNSAQPAGQYAGTYTVTVAY